MESSNQFVVQALSNTVGWVNTRYSSDDLETALRLERELLAKDSSWMPGKRQTRIADRLSADGV